MEYFTHCIALCLVMFVNYTLSVFNVTIVEGQMTHKQARRACSLLGTNTTGWIDPYTTIHVQNELANHSSLMWIDGNIPFRNWMIFAHCHGGTIKTREFSKNLSSFTNNYAVECSEHCNNNDFVLSVDACFCLNDVTLHKNSYCVPIKCKGSSNIYCGSLVNCMCKYDVETDEDMDIENDALDNHDSSGITTRGSQQSNAGILHECAAIIVTGSTVRFISRNCRERNHFLCDRYLVNQENNNIYVTSTEYQWSKTDWIDAGLQCQHSGFLYGLKNEWLTQRREIIDTCEQNVPYWIGTFRRRPFRWGKSESDQKCVAASLTPSNRLDVYAINCSYRLSSLCLISLINDGNTDPIRSLATLYIATLSGSVVGGSLLLTLIGICVVVKKCQRTNYDSILIKSNSFSRNDSDVNNKESCYTEVDMDCDNNTGTHIYDNESTYNEIEMEIYHEIGQPITRCTSSRMLDVPNSSNNNCQFSSLDSYDVLHKSADDVNIVHDLKGYHSMEDILRESAYDETRGNRLFKSDTDIGEQYDTMESIKMQTTNKSVRKDRDV